jgi:tetratricopeptide (TPR) repeat protein
MASQNAYSVLGLRKGISEDEIKRAYVELVKRFDPEKHTDRFMVIQTAYENLRDPARRAREDILTFNYIKGSFHFTPAEKAQEPDPQLNHTLQELEAKLAEDSSNGDFRSAYITVLMKRSFKKAKKHLWAEAIEDWQKVLTVDPTHQRAKNNMFHSLIALGYSYAEHELYAEAIDLWEKALHMNPDNGELLHNLAIACEFAGKTEPSRRYWTEVLKRWQAHLQENPDDAYVQNCIIEVRRHHGGKALDEGAARGDSIEEYREILKIRPDDFDAQFKVASALMEEHKWLEALQALGALSRQYPKNIEVLNLLGWAFLNSGRIEQAFQAWNRALTLDPKNHSTREAIIKARMSIGRAYRGKGMHTQSLVHFKALLRLEPNSAETYLEIGQTYMQKGDKRSAAQAFTQVMRLDPKNRAVKQFLSEMKLRA